MKKILLLTSILILVLTFTPPLLAQTVNLQYGLVAHYPFEEDADDLVGNYYGTEQNTPEYVDAVIGKGVKLEGSKSFASASGDHVLLPKINFEAMDEFTVSLWVKDDGMDHEHGEFYINYGNHYYGVLGIGRLWRDGTGKWLLTFCVGTILRGSAEEGTSLTFNIDETSESNKFNLYTLVYNNNTIHAYRNGSLLGTKYEVVSISGDNAAIARHWWDETSTRFNGIIDDVRIYNRALSVAEVKALYDMGEEEDPDITFTVKDIKDNPIANTELEVYKVTTDQIGEKVGTVDTDSDGKFNTKNIIYSGSEKITDVNQLRILTNVDTIPQKNLIVSNPNPNLIEDENIKYIIQLDNGILDEYGNISYSIEEGNNTKDKEITLGHTMLAFNIVVLVEWKANQDYINWLKQNFKNMSNYLFDVYDGQVYINNVYIYNDALKSEKGLWDSYTHNLYKIRTANNVSIDDIINKKQYFKSTPGFSLVVMLDFQEKYSIKQNMTICHF